MITENEAHEILSSTHKKMVIEKMRRIIKQHILETKCRSYDNLNLEIKKELADCLIESEPEEIIKLYEDQIKEVFFQEASKPLP